MFAPDSLLLVKCIERKNATKLTIPTYNSLLSCNKYTALQLKQIATYYNLPSAKYKHEVYSEILDYLTKRYTENAISIQKHVRKYLTKCYIFYRGPALKNRKLCINETDFITMENINEIENCQFISYIDNSGMIYGFDINSLHHLMKSKEKCINPYTRMEIPLFVCSYMRKITRLSKIIGEKINLEYEDAVNHLSDEKKIQLKAISTFQSINLLGNYSDASWFLSLNRRQLAQFLKELASIWSYRANLSHDTKQNICPRMSNPFHIINTKLFTEGNEEDTIHAIRENVLNLINVFINNGIDADSKSLGAYYVLGSLTLVSTDAANSLTWLYNAMAY
jgi:hypothetical protein